MADEQTNEEQGQELAAQGVVNNKATGTMVPNTDSTPEGEAPGNTPAQDEREGSEDDLPEWARKQLKKARDEAASYRVRSKELSDKLANAKTPEEFAKAQEDWAKETRSLERELIAAQYGLPETLAARLQGSTREELEADAKALRELVAPKAKETLHHEDASGGLNPTTDDELRMTPEELAKIYGQKRIIF